MANWDVYLLKPEEELAAKTPAPPVAAGVQAAPEIPAMPEQMGEGAIPEQAITEGTVSGEAASPVVTPMLGKVLSALSPPAAEVPFPDVLPEAYRGQWEEQAKTTGGIIPIASQGGKTISELVSMLRSAKGIKGAEKIGMALRAAGSAKAAERLEKISSGETLSINVDVAKDLAKGNFPEGTVFTRGKADIPPVQEPGFYRQPELPFYEPAELKSLEEVPLTSAQTEVGGGILTKEMAMRGVKRDQAKTMSGQLLEEAESIIRDPQRLDKKADLNILANDWGFRDIAEAMQAAKGKVSEAAGFMNKFSQMSRYLNAQDAAWMKSVIEKGRLPGPGAWFQHWYQRVDNIRRGLMVTQIATAMRNFETQVGRVAMDVPEKFFNHVFGKVFGVEGMSRPTEGLDSMFELFRSMIGKGHKAEIEQLLSGANIKYYNRLYGTYSNDIRNVLGEQGAPEAGVSFLNSVNKWQEFTVRDAVFWSELEAMLSKRGVNLADVVRDSLPNAVRTDEMAKAVDLALEKTFALSPKFGTLAQKMVSGAHIPGISYLIPFPRFLYNSFKFQYEYSPLGFLSLVKPAMKRKIAAGDIEALSKATLGTMMYLTAWQIRNSEFAGEQPWELKINGRTFDTRPYNPFMNYFVIADIVKRVRDGKGETVNANMITQGLLGQSIKSRSIGMMADSVVNVFLGDKSEQMLQEWIGGTLIAPWVTPLQTFTDIANAFDLASKQDSWSKGVKEWFMGSMPAMEKKTSPILGELTSRLPGTWGEPAYSPTHEGPIMRPAVGLRQMTGVTLKEKNSFEKTLDRLGYAPGEIFKSTGVPKADNLIKKWQGMVCERIATRIVESQQFQNMDDHQQAAFISSKLLPLIRNAAKKLAKHEDPKLMLAAKLHHKFTDREQRVLKDRGVDVDAIVKKLSE